MRIVTVINDTSNFGFNLLRLSCALNDLQLVVLVSGENFNSNRIKDELLEDYLSEVDNDEIILFTDGNDAVFMAHEDEILSKFSKMNSELVFSAEMTCWPDISLAEKHPNTSSGPYKYLNSGGFIGKAGFIKRLLKDVNLETENFERSNQYLWIQRYFKNSDKMALDTNCEIFSTFTPQMVFPQSKDQFPEYFALINKWFDSNFILKKGRIFNRVTETSPCHAHFNGFSKTLIHKHIVDLIYEKTPAGNKAQFYFAE